MLYHPKNNFRYYSMRNLVKTFPFYIDLTTKKYLIFFLAGPQCSLVKINGRNSLLKLPKTLHRLWVDKREVELQRNIVGIDLIKVNWQPNQGNAFMITVTNIETYLLMTQCTMIKLCLYIRDGYHESITLIKESKLTPFRFS